MHTLQYTHYENTLEKGVINTTQSLTCHISTSLKVQKVKVNSRNSVMYWGRDIKIDFLNNFMQNYPRIELEEVLVFLFTLFTASKKAKK